MKEQTRLHAGQSIINHQPTHKKIEQNLRNDHVQRLPLARLPPALGPLGPLGPAPFGKFPLPWDVCDLAIASTFFAFFSSLVSLILSLISLHDA